MKSINDTVFRLYLYAVTCKMIHYTTDKSYTHELADKVQDAITKFADKFAEQFYGYEGKPNKSELALNVGGVKEEDTLSAICQDVIDIVESLRSQFEKNPKLSDLVSLIDDFKGQMRQHKFLSTFDHLS